MRCQSIKPEDLIEGLTPVPSGVVRVMELQERAMRISDHEADEPVGAHRRG